MNTMNTTKKIVLSAVAASALLLGGASAGIVGVIGAENAGGGIWYSNANQTQSAGGGIWYGHSTKDSGLSQATGGGIWY